jgi:hypothetical protein
MTRLFVSNRSFSNQSNGQTGTLDTTVVAESVEIRFGSIVQPETVSTHAAHLQVPATVEKFYKLTVSYHAGSVFYLGSGLVTSQGNECKDVEIPLRWLTSNPVKR